MIRCKALEDIAAERHRQIESEGWKPEHDDEHGLGELAGAAAAYAMADDFPNKAAELWPWEIGADGKNWWKPSDRRRNLVKAGALIVAEIERLDRIVGVATDVQVADGKCAGGQVPPFDGECPKCGATEDEKCPYETSN